MDISLHLSAQVFLIPLSINPEKNMLIACCRSQAEKAAAFDCFLQLQKIAERLECDWVGIRLGVRLVCEVPINFIERIKQFFKNHGRITQERPHYVCTYTCLEDAAIKWQQYCHTEPRSNADLTILVMQDDGILRLFACSTMRKEKGRG